MRILHVRFSNLNSLAGEWEIDFAHPAFASDGIFAIAGPTGAGKSTILDAICLALYGRTPRLGKISKSANEIMSRQTGECFAEATFETESGRFRCLWSQHRARRRPDGELQSPKHEISDAATGKIFETKLRDVAEQIKAVTGMDFEQFTRSMLLAQGGFAAFLQASPDERSPILEQMTGTEIYTRISMRTHERRSCERRKLEELREEKAGMQLLAPEEEQLLSTGLEEKIQQDRNLDLEIRKTSDAKAWLGGMAQIEDELKRFGQQKDALRIRMEAFAPNLEKLQRASMALELASSLSALDESRRRQMAEMQALGQSRDAMPSKEEAARQAVETVSIATRQLESAKEAQQQAMPAVRRARELDLKLAEKDQPLKAAMAAADEQEKMLTALKAKQRKDCAELADGRLRLDELRQQMKATKTDEGLTEQLGAMQGRFEALQHLRGQLNDKLEAMAQADRRVQEAARLCQEQTAKLKEEQRRLDRMQTDLAAGQIRLGVLLEGRELVEWRNRMATLTARKRLLADAVQVVQQLRAAQQGFAELGRREAELCAEKQVLLGQLASQIERQTGLEKEVALLEDQLALLKKIDDFKEARKQLRDGVACPLCGAHEHPFALGNIPVPDETRQRLGAARNERKAAADAVADLKVGLARTGKDIEQTAVGRQKHSERIETTAGWVATTCSELGLDAASLNLEVELRMLHEGAGRELERTSGIAQAAEQADKELSRLRAELEKVGKTTAKIEREAQAAVHGQDAASQLLEQLVKEKESVGSQMEQQLAALQKEVQKFGVVIQALDDLEPVLGQLAGRRDHWMARQQAKVELERQLAVLETKTNHQAEQISRCEGELNRLMEQGLGLRRELALLRLERCELFGDRQPDKEEARLLAAVEAAGQSLDGVRQQQTATGQELKLLRSKIEELAKSVEARASQLQSEEEAFLMRIKEVGFADEHDLRAAAMTEGKRKSLEQQSRLLADEQTGLAAKEREKLALLDAERRKQLTDRPKEQIEQELAELLVAQKALQQEIGGLRQRLKDNEIMRRKHLDQAQAVDAQRRECARWDALHELIGSSDGKKYRNFAQGLTFEVMIGHANRQLQKMTDRYLLVRSELQPLELSVIDGYQAGEIRSARNLSGGESFIVSLALALGLSQMASRNIRVDSLFLDEGFGTLDEEALDTALETLAGLRQDGKLIGIISHVQALKERISAQIQVTPLTGGRSVLVGPGCRRVPARASS